jgi:hypothetical protein
MYIVQEHYLYTITLETVSAGDHWDLKISRQMAPLLKQKLYYFKNI